ncbi:MAG: LarC family nickel insertion protein, partial [Cohaesibacter sp.]|nr:LarC family nickel insertion protein [Cohaesibacter sp.]
TALLAEGIAVYGSYSGSHLSLSDHRQSTDQAAIAAKGGDGELATPTGLALLRHYCRSFGPMAPMTIQGQAFGAGKKDFDHPNVVRFLFGDLAPSCFHDMSGAGVEPVDASGLKQDRIVELEANIDDLSAELTAPLMQALLDIGALDVFFTPIMMKKGRLAQKLSILCQPGQEMEIVCHVMRHTTTLGVRRVSKERFKLDRCFEALSTPYGSV